MTKAIKRSEVIHVRLTEEERARFADLCAPGDLPVSEAVRRLMREAAGLGPTFEGEVAEKIDGLTQQLKAIGVDLSEAVRAINVGKAPEAVAMRTTFEGFAEMLWEVEGFYRSLCAVARERRRVTESAP
jgi:antitoxin component of RelBE/YafQ-DinJ toxin-antitoxin module